MSKLRILEGALWTVLIAAIGYGAFCYLEASNTRFTRPVLAQQASSDVDGPIVAGVSANAYGSNTAIADGAVIGELSIPALKLSVPIVEGMTRGDLLRGIGHVPGTGVAGGLGNMALAAHRDTFFRPLRNVKAGMPVLVRSSEGVYTYAVESTEVVDPEQVRVLDIGGVPQVTLITCFPFDYVGAAPKRFIVHASLVSLIPAEAGSRPPSTRSR